MLSLHPRIFKPKFSALTNVSKIISLISTNNMKYIIIFVYYQRFKAIFL